MVRQIESSGAQPAQKFAPEGFYGWLEKQRGMAERVVVCYEAGCFGYEPARRMEAMGGGGLGDCAAELGRTRQASGQR